MKNILHENMQRFRTKNLSESNIKNLNKITALNEGYVTGRYKGKKSSEDIGYLERLSKATVNYKGDISRLSGDSRISVRLDAPAKTSNIVYQLEVYPRGVKAAFGNLFSRGGTLVVDKLVKIGNNDSNNSFPDEIPINLSVPFKGTQSVIRTKFNFPMPLPKAIVVGTQAKPKISFETSSGTAGYLGYAATYKMEARLIHTTSREEAEASVTKYYQKYPGKALKVGSKELKDVAAYMADWDARNPSGTATSDTVVTLTENFGVSITQDAIPVVPSQARG